MGIKRERERKRETRVIMTTTSTTLASLLKDDKSKVATLVACGASAAALIYYNREVRNQIANIFMGAAVATSGPGVLSGSTNANRKQEGGNAEGGEAENQQQLMAQQQQQQMQGGMPGQEEVVDEAANQPVIMFIDDIHNLIPPPPNGNNGSAILKPALGRGLLRCIGCTSMDKFKKSIETDAALERRFQQIPVEEPDVDFTVSILRGLRPRYEQHHNIAISEGALLSAAQLSARYVSG